MDRFPRSDSIVQARSGLQTYMAQVYGWMILWLNYCPACAGVCSVGTGA